MKEIKWFAKIHHQIFFCNLSTEIFLRENNKRSIFHDLQLRNNSEPDPDDNETVNQFVMIFSSRKCLNMKNSLKLENIFQSNMILCSNFWSPVYTFATEKHLCIVNVCVWRFEFIFTTLWHETLLIIIWNKEELKIMRHTTGSREWHSSVMDGQLKTFRTMPRILIVGSKIFYD